MPTHLRDSRWSFSNFDPPGGRSSAWNGVWANTHPYSSCRHPKRDPLVRTLKYRSRRRSFSRSRLVSGGLPTDGGEPSRVGAHATQRAPSHCAAAGDNGAPVANQSRTGQLVGVLGSRPPACILAVRRSERSALAKSAPGAHRRGTHASTGTSGTSKEEEQNAGGDYGPTGKRGEKVERLVAWCRAATRDRSGRRNRVALSCTVEPWSPRARRPDRVRHLSEDRRVPNLLPRREPRPQPLIGGVAIGVAGVLREDRLRPVVHRIAMWEIDRSPVELAQLVADRAETRASRRCSRDTVGRSRLVAAECLDPFTLRTRCAVPSTPSRLLVRSPATPAAWLGRPAAPVRLSSSST